MKRFLLLVVLLAVTVGTFYAQAQDNTYQVVTTPKMPVFGIKGGLNISNIKGTNNDDNIDKALGLHAGIFMQYNVLNMVYFQPELFYTQKGYKSDFSIGDLKTKTSDSYDYVELPLLIKLSFGSPMVKIQPYVGPSVSYLVNAKSKVTTTLGSLSTTNTNNVIDDMHLFDIGLSLGGDLVINDKLMLGARYNYGLSKIYDNDTDVQNGVLMLTVGFLFDY